jgi:hypothetical protein
MSQTEGADICVVCHGLGLRSTFELGRDCDPDRGVELWFTCAYCARGREDEDQDEQPAH